MDFELNLKMKSEDSSLYQAIKENTMEEIKLLLEDGRDLNDPVVTTGPFAGYTALHVACMENNDELVGLLIKEYEVDVNAVAEDGTQPLHLACFYEPIYYSRIGMSKVFYLLKANANTNAEIDREMFSKHIKDHEWCPDFGDKITLLIYTVLYGKQRLTIYFTLSVGSHLSTKSLTNKTLLMYIIERNYWDSMQLVFFECRENPENLNFKDNDGIPVTHYLFHPKRYGNYRYNTSEQFGTMSTKRGERMEMFFRGATDMYALINNDPATFIPNMAAYRSCSQTLKNILPYYTSISLSKALYYATLQVDENSDNYICIDDEEYAEPNFYLGALQEQRKECTKVILKDLINRLTFGLFVPKEEKKLMDKLIATDAEIKKFVDNYQTEFIEGELKTKFIELIDKKMSLYDFIMDICDNRKLKLMARDKDLLGRFFETLKNDNNDNYRYFKISIQCRIENASIRLPLLKSLQKISTVTEAIPLPYELILDIIEYLSNKELDIFIQAFISSP